MNVDAIGSNSDWQYALQGKQGMRPPPPPRPPEKIEDLIGQVDSNGNGTLNIEELDISESAFSKIDTDGDGLLTQKEIETKLKEGGLEDNKGIMGKFSGKMPDPAQMIEDLLAKNDSNEDGVLSTSEFQVNEEIFLKIDSNSDGALSKEELKADMDKHMAEKPNETPPLIQQTQPEKDATKTLLEILFQKKDNDSNNNGDFLNITA